VDRTGNYSFADIGAAVRGGPAEARSADAGSSSTFEVRPCMCLSYRAKVAFVRLSMSAERAAVQAPMRACCWSVAWKRALHMRTCLLATCSLMRPMACLALEPRPRRPRAQALQSTLAREGGRLGVFGALIGDKAAEVTALAQQSFGEMALPSALQHALGRVL